MEHFSNHSRAAIQQIKHQNFVVRLGFLIITLLTSCNYPGFKPDTSLQETQIALGIQATTLANLQTEQAAVPPATATNHPSETPEPTATDDLAATRSNQATQIAFATEATIAAQQLTQLAAQLSAEPTATNQAPTSTSMPPTSTEPPSPAIDFETWMDSANILLYEDMSGDFSTTRYVQMALDGMGLMYVDVKDALGRYKDQLLTAGPGGQGWDLIISAKELRTAVSGEFYVYLNDSLNLGSSVIIEDWDLDAIGNGKISLILTKCGASVQSDWWDDPLTEQLLWAVDGTSSFHHFPNEGISLRNPSGYWSGDLGDFLRLTPGSKAAPLWSARTNAKSEYLTMVSCLDNQLVIQTHSTHSYGRDRSMQMWQNLIYNTLEARFKQLYP